MFNSAIIDVAIGMVLSFLAVSLAASAITEAISSWRQWRLADGIKALLNFHPEDHPLALDLYKSALISPLTSGTAESFEDIKHNPPSTGSRKFALAFYNALGGGLPSVVIGKIQDPQLKAAIEAVWATSSN